MSSVKQPTLNEHVNTEAIGAYADMLHEYAQSERQAGRTYLAAELDHAANVLTGAVRLAQAAVKQATDAAYDRIYGGPQE